MCESFSSPLFYLCDTGHRRAWLECIAHFTFSNEFPHLADRTGRQGLST